MVNELTYNEVCRRLENINCTEIQLDILKREFGSKICSKRRVEQIKNIKQLLDIMRKRDVVNETEWESLKTITNLLHRDDIWTTSMHVPTERIPQEQVLPQLPLDIYERIFRIIAEDIGHKWKEFARALNIKEGQIDDLESRHKYIADRVMEILKFHQTVCNKRFWRSSLSEALCTARRKDISLKICQELDIYG